MDDDAPHAASHLFTLRVWLQALGDGQSEWRGQIRYVLTGETYYFREWDQLREMLRRCLPGFDMESRGQLTRHSRYRPRTEGLFAHIQHHMDAQNDYWEVRSKDRLVTSGPLAGYYSLDHGAPWPSFRRYSEPTASTSTTLKSLLRLEPSRKIRFAFLLLILYNQKFTTYH